MTSHSSDRDPSRQVLDALSTAPARLRHSAREAIEDGNLETFISLVSEFLQTPAPGHTEPRLRAAALNRVDWDWLAGELLAGPDSADAEPPPPEPRPE